MINLHEWLMKSRTPVIRISVQVLKEYGSAHSTTYGVLYETCNAGIWATTMSNESISLLSTFHFNELFSPII